MKKALGLLGDTIVAFLLALSLAEFHPHPYAYDAPIFFGTLAVFFVSYFLSSNNVRSTIVMVSFLTSAVFSTLWLWYWIGAWEFGVWYPRAPEILQRFIHIDGESGYNAAVSNLFLLIWSIAVAIWVVWDRCRNPSLNRTHRKRFVG